MPRLPPRATRDALDAAVAAGAEPFQSRGGQQGLLVRAPGRRAIRLFTDAGALNDAGTYYFQKRAVAPPDRGFDPNQEPVLHRRREQIMLRDGSMGTLHANSPREAISRMESMITMGGYGLPSKTIREMIVGSVDVIIQAARLRDGSRRITHITEVVGLEGDVIVTQDLFVYEITGEDENGKIIGRHRSTGIARPRFWDRARYYGLERELAEALDAAE